MPGLEILQGQATAPGATETALTMAAGNSLTIRNCPPDARPILLGMWATVQATGIGKIRSPRLHDDVQGIRFRTIATVNNPLLFQGGNQKFYPQDTLRASLSGSAGAGDIEMMNLLVYYPSLPGADARLANYADVKDKIVNLVTVETAHATGTAGGWSGQVALNSSFDLLKANTDYCLLGYQTDTLCGAVRLLGSDTGNIGIGGPGIVTNTVLTSEWFWKLAMMTGLPLIPIINSSNVAGILCDVCVDENGANPNVSWIFGQLS